MIDLNNLTIEKAHKSLKAGEYTVVELAQAYLDVIKEKNPDLNAYLEVYDDVIQQAESAQAMFAYGSATLLTGIPIAVKDNILIKGKHVSAASKMLEGYTATYDATVVAKLKNEGVVFLGRTNMDEFAMGSSTENSAFGVTKNPIDYSRVPGGTSGGSAAAVASNMALVALGSDTGGSVRQPAAFCGVVGYKPSYGMVSRHGLIADTSSFDQIGPLAKNSRDAQIVLAAIVGNDGMEATSEDIVRKEFGSEKLKIGVPKNFLTGEGIDTELLSNFNDTIKKLESDGHVIVDVEIPLLEYALAIYYILQPAEVSSNLARFDGVRYGAVSAEANTLYELYAKTRGSKLGHEARRRILLGTYVLSHGYYDAYYRKADILRNSIKESFNNVFNKSTGGVDIILTPTTPKPAFKIGENTHDPMSMYLEDIFTVPLNIAGIPGISIPCGTSSEGLPFGLQIIGPKGSDFALLETSKSFERVLQ